MQEHIDLSIGELLLRARFYKGVTLEEAAEETKIQASYLDALEQDDPAKLPHSVYVKGFLRNYAEYLDLDPEGVLRLYYHHYGRQASQVSVIRKSHSLQPTRFYDFSRSPFVIGGSILLVLVLGYLVVKIHGALQPVVLTSTPTPVLNLPTPVTDLHPQAIAGVHVSLKPKAARVAELRLLVRAQRDVYVQVSVDGHPSSTRFIPAGDSLSWTAKQHLHIRCYNAGACDMMINGKYVGVLGDYGEVAVRDYDL